MANADAPPGGFRASPTGAYRRLDQTRRDDDGTRPTSRTLAVTRTLKILIGTGLLAGLVALLSASPASAGAPCWKTLINDWYDGRIDSIYPIHCYRDALKHLPEDVGTYSSARDDITRALQARIAGKGNGPQPSKPKSGKHSAGGGVPAKGSGSGGGPTPGTPYLNPDRGPSKSPSAGSGSPGRDKGSGPVTVVFKKIGPNNPDSVPIPLIVLAAIAMLLLAAGSTGFIVRRIQARRVPIRPTGSTPQSRTPR